MHGYAVPTRYWKKHRLPKKKKRHPNGITWEDAAAPYRKWLTDITEI